MKWFCWTCGAKGDHGTKAKVAYMTVAVCDGCVTFLTRRDAAAKAA